MTSRARIPTLAVTVAALILVSGCAAPMDTAATPTPTPPVTSGPSGSWSPEPASPSPSGSAETIATPSGFGALALGMPYDDAVAAAGASPVEICPWIATVDQDGFTTTVQESDAGTDASLPLELVSVSVMPGQLEPVGPRTGKDVGLGSTVDEVRAVYPDAEEVASVGDRRHLLIETGPSAHSLWLTYSESSPTIWAITATSLDQPPYESCS